MPWAIERKPVKNALLPQREGPAPSRRRLNGGEVYQHAATRVRAMFQRFPSLNWSSFRNEQRRWAIKSDAMRHRTPKSTSCEMYAPTNSVSRSFWSAPHVLALLSLCISSNRPHNFAFLDLISEI